LVRDADEAEDTEAEAGAGTECGGDIGGAGHPEERDGQVSQGCHDLSAASFAYGRAVFIEGNIADIMEAVFDRPLAAAQTEESGGVSFLRGQAGEAIDGFGAVFLGDDFGGYPLDAEDLGGIGKGEIIRQFGAGPDVADFQSAVGFIGGGVVRGEKPSS